MVLHMAVSQKNKGKLSTGLFQYDALSDPLITSPTFGSC